MRKKRTSLDAFISLGDEASPAATPPSAASTAPSRREKVKGTHQLSVYAPIAAYEQLRRLAFDKHGKMHDFLIEGLDLVFRQHGLPSIAELKARGGDA